MIPDTSDMTMASSLMIKKRLMISDSSNVEPRPKRLMLFAWQAPLMSLSYAIICFLAGMTAVVIGPLAAEPKWGDDAKVGVDESRTARNLNTDSINRRSSFTFSLLHLELSVS